MATNPLRIILLRHGEAERLAERDELRQLTSYGRRQVATTAEQIAALSLAPYRVLSSPYVRACETADIIANLLRADLPETLLGICPDDNPMSAIRAIESMAAPGVTLVVVTHMPLIGALLTLLVEGHTQNEQGIGTAAGALLEADSLGLGLARSVAWLGMT